MKIHTCPTCTNAIQCNGQNDNRKQFCFFKAFDQTENTFGGLHVPINCFLDYIERCIFQKLFNCHNGLDYWKKCDEYPFKFVQKLFLRLCIYYGLKFVNHELSNTKKMNRKKLKVAHLTLTSLKYIFYYKTGVKSNVDGNHTQVKLLRCCYTE